MRSRSGELARNLELLLRSGTVAGLSDAELLERFALRCAHDRASAEVAFEAIVARHGRMVLGVCRQVLREPSDVDDAFQATFLVLVRKAQAVRVKDSLAPWLYSVAYRTAIKARSLAVKRKKREAEILVQSSEPESPDNHAVLHEELNRLPEKYCAPVVLCHLEGLSHEEAARQLHWPVGTVSGRLSRARDLLRDRLTRRGLGASASVAWGLLVPSRSGASVPRVLLISTVQSATTLASGGSLSGTVWLLTRGVLSTMFWSKLKVASLVVFGVGAMGLGGGYTFSQGAAGKAEKPSAVADPPKAPPVAKAVAAPKPAEIKAPQPPVGQPGNYGQMMGGMPQVGPSLSGHVSGSIVVAPAKEKNKIWAMSLTARLGGETQWQEFTAPEGAVVGWTMPSPLLLATSQYDVTVEELAVFDADEGKWKTIALKTKDQEVHGPYQGPSCVVYIAGKFAYGYSGKVHVWNVVDLKAEGTPLCISFPNATLLQQGGMLYVYNPVNGAWTPGVEVNDVSPQPRREPEGGEKVVPGGMSRRNGGMGGGMMSGMGGGFR